jgi:excisionase family DNA binding protein
VAVPKEKLLTLDEVADQLSVTVETVRRWIRSGEMEAIDLGGRAGYRVSESALERFIKERVKSSRSDG